MKIELSLSALNLVCHGLQVMQQQTQAILTDITEQVAAQNPELVSQKARPQANGIDADPG